MAFPVVTSRDSNWIATAALNKIGAASVDNTPEAEDLTLALDRLNDLAADFVGRGVVYIADLDATPSAIAFQLANALALALQSDFPMSVPPNAIPPQPVIEDNLRRIQSDQPSYGPAQVSYF